MSRLKEWWMEQIDIICDRYAARRRAGMNKTETFNSAIEALSLLGLSPVEAETELLAYWDDSPP